MLKEKESQKHHIIRGTIRKGILKFGAHDWIQRQERIAIDLWKNFEVKVWQHKVKKKQLREDCCKETESLDQMHTDPS